MRGWMRACVCASLAGWLAGEGVSLGLVWEFYSPSIQLSSSSADERKVTFEGLEGHVSLSTSLSPSVYFCFNPVVKSGLCNSVSQSCVASEFLFELSTASLARGSISSSYAFTASAVKPCARIFWARRATSWIALFRPWPRSARPIVCQHEGRWRRREGGKEETYGRSSGAPHRPPSSRCLPCYPTLRAPSS